LASTSSIMRWSVAVMTPLASSVIWDTENRFPFRVGWFSRPVGRCYSWRAAYAVVVGHMVVTDAQ
jgi:hypothetical protein